MVNPSSFIELSIFSFISNSSNAFIIFSLSKAMTEKAMPNPSLFSNLPLVGRLINPCLQLIDSYGETYVSISGQIVYIAFLSNMANG